MTPEKRDIEHEFNMRRIVADLRTSAVQVVNSWGLFFPSAKAVMNESFMNHLGPIRENRGRLRYTLSQDPASRRRTLTVEGIHELGQPCSGVLSSIQISASFSADREVFDE